MPCLHPPPGPGKVASATVLATILLGACASPPTPHQRPPLPVAQTLDGSQEGSQKRAQEEALPGADAASQQAVESLGWVRDAALQGVIALALEHNRDLRMALHNVERARAQYGITRANLQPDFSAQGQASRASSQDGIRAGAQLGFSSYELDFWGRVRHTSGAAQAQFLRMQESRRSVQIALVADVAAAWLNLAAAGSSLRLARQTLASRQEAQALLVRMHELGAASGLVLAQGEAALHAAHGELAAWSAQAQRARNALELLAGRALPERLLPPALPGPLVALADVLHPLPSPLPSRVLLARPDVQAAENQLRAMQANIDAARAALLPSINLVFNLSRSGWSFGPRLQLPIFDGGRRRRAVEVAEADQLLALAAYEKAVQTAFREAADALADRAQWQARIAAQDKLVAATQKSLALARARFAAGAENHLAVLDAQRGLYAAQQARIALHLSEQVGRITLWKVLGAPPRDLADLALSAPAP